ncbi:MAG: hypothetical protein DWQ19_10505 [Crenarchaeota archaeon]|nr:MAG: hypothetical protein DWQ19_10505 [Thermoproteota archaeon]
MSTTTLPQRKFGLEFEIGNDMKIANIGELAKHIKDLSKKHVEYTPSWAQTVNNHNYWHIKFDRTCGPQGQVNGTYMDHGWEIASFIASGQEDLDLIGMVVESLKNDCFINQNCGFHIHCDVSDFTPSQMGVLLARWLKIEPLLCQMVPPFRVNNKFCRLLGNKRFLKSKKYKSEELWDKLKPTKYGPHENSQKKVTLNTVNYAAAVQMVDTSRKTVEFRLPEGTLDKHTVVGWVQFFIRFVETARTAKMPLSFRRIKTIKTFFNYAGMNPNHQDIDVSLIRAKMFLAERLYRFGDIETKKQLSSLIF